MNCFRCNAPLTQYNRCPNCGADVRVNKRIMRLSNAWYNEALRFAAERNLTAARNCLLRSLRFNKENIGARNLIGLIYYETGHVVEALNQWNISQTMQPVVNPATRYLGEFSQDPHVLEKVRQSVSKYNTAVNFAQQNNEDLAVIQLNKAVSMNSHMVDAFKLLGLIHIKRKEYGKARRFLRRAYQIDNGDPDTILYLREAKAQYTKAVSELKQQSLFFRLRYAWNAKRAKAYEEFDETGFKKAVPRILYVLAGMLFGFLAAVFLVMPARQRLWENDYHDRELHLYQTLSIPKVTEVPTPAPTPSITPVPENFADMVLGNGDVFGSISALAVPEGANAESIFNQGTAAWETQDYNTCKTCMQQVLVLQDATRDTATYMNALYYLGRCYEETAESDKALVVYTKIKELYPGTSMEETADYHIGTLSNAVG